MSVRKLTLALLVLCIVLVSLPLSPERVEASKTIYTYESFEWGIGGDQLVDGGGPNEWIDTGGVFGANALISAGPPGFVIGGLPRGGSRCAWVFGDGAKRPRVGLECDVPDEVFELSFYSSTDATPIETVDERGAQVLTYDTPGTYEWTCPEDVVGLNVETWGGGGAGGWGNAARAVGTVPDEATFGKSDSYLVEALVWTEGGQGGGGGAYSRSEIEVTPDKQYSIVVGAGGVSQMGPGGDSSFKYGPDTLVKAVGATADEGGSADDCVGDIAYSGGDGYVPGAEFYLGGGGGGSGGYSSAGEDGDGNVGGSAVAGGAPGANGVSYGMPGGMGVGPGGGGGGPGAGNHQGGNGGPGQVRITYIYIVNPPILSITVADVSGTNVRLNGELLDDGGENCTVSLVWGVTNAGIVLEDWDYVGEADEPEQPQAAGEFYRDIEVEGNTIYYWSATAVNSRGGSWADSGVFVAFVGGGGCAGDPLPPSSFTAVMVGVDSISLTWEKRQYADYTLIVMSREGYPDSIDSGDVIYYNTGTEYLMPVSELEDYGGYFFSGWGANECGLSDSYATTTLTGGGLMANAMVMGVLCLLLMFASAFGDWRRFWPLIIIASLGWFFSAGWAMYLSLNAHDGYWVVAVVCIGMALATVMWPFLMKGPPPKIEEIDEEAEAWGGKRKKRYPGRIDIE